jgi:hypothetical protein
MQLHNLLPESCSGNERALPMSQVRSMAITCACMLSCFPGPAVAGDNDILVARKDCASGVHLVVRGAPLADVLTRLSGAGISASAAGLQRFHRPCGSIRASA